MLFYKVFGKSAEGAAKENLQVVADYYLTLRGVTPVLVAGPSQPVHYADDIETVWGLHSSLKDSPAARKILMSRGLDPSCLQDVCRGAARKAPVTSIPAYLRNNQNVPYYCLGYELYVPMYDVHGAMQSVVARRHSNEGTGPKSLAARGCNRTGLVFACPIALETLAVGTTQPRIVIAEGEIDYLTSVQCSEGQWGTIGILQGSWTEDHADRLAGCQVAICTDYERDSKEPIPPGEVFAQFISSTFNQGTSFHRWTPTAGKDLNEHYLSTGEFDPWK